MVHLQPYYKSYFNWVQYYNKQDTYLSSWFGEMWVNSKDAIDIAVLRDVHLEKEMIILGAGVWLPLFTFHLVEY